jgi:glycosyltransferase involved in cell wall biosynthesis
VSIPFNTAWPRCSPKLTTCDRVELSPVVCTSFVFLSTTDWDAPQFGSRQQIAQLLARRGHQVLFVEVPRALHSLISAPAETRRALTRLGRVRAIEPGLFAYTPRPVLPIYYHPATNWVNQRWLARDVRRALRELGWSAPDVLWTYWPNSADLVGKLGERAAVYHCIDEFATRAYPLVGEGVIARMEAELCRKVDIVFARTEALAAAKRRMNPKTEFLPGGVDVALFDPARVAGVAPALAALPAPRVGFLGTVDDRVDVKLLSTVARRLAHVTFVLAGPVKQHLVDLSALTALPNVHLLPAYAHTDAPAMIAALDLCLIPYRINSYTEGLSPLKLYEYLAMGKPVVSTDLPYVRREAAHIAIAQDADAFVAAIQRYLQASPTPQQQATWRAAAAAVSWESQVAQIEATLAPLLVNAR